MTAPEEFESVQDMAEPTPGAVALEVVRKPLSQEALEAIAMRPEFWDHHFGFSNFYWDRFARAIETAHGIT